MKFDNYINLDSDERLNVFLSTLSVTNRTPEYYVNWTKVERETRKFELELNTLNYLIGKEDIYNESLMGTSKNTSRASRASNLSLIYSLFLVNFCL